MRSSSIFILLSCFFATGIGVRAQGTGQSSASTRARIQAYKDFGVFAPRQDSLFLAAYEKRDLVLYDRLLTEFLSRYNALDPVAKKTYLNYLVNAYYDLCCTYSMINKKAEALHYLEISIKAGFSDYAHLLVDTDLENIRGEERFRQLVKPLRETGDYLYIIRKAAAYNTLEKRELPAFSYLPASNPDLTALRNAFNLDSIAGKGNDVSRMINLMVWVHNLVPHDGNNENPAVKNAMSLITVCKRDHRGLNCRGLATVLNECYLSLGFRSRFVTCLPKDSLGIDTDCHVIDMVWSASLKKWVWMDPTFGAYVMDEKGEVLGLSEVRERIIDGRPLILNPDANWNHQVSQTKEGYLYRYMAKNLYLLQCPVNSGFDLETRASGKEYVYTELLPLDYFRQAPIRSETAFSNNNGVSINYLTNDPEKFWAAPR